MLKKSFILTGDLLVHEDGTLLSAGELRSERGAEVVEAEQIALYQWMQEKLTPHGENVTDVVLEMLNEKPESFQIFFMAAVQTIAMGYNQWGKKAKAKELFDMMHKSGVPEGLIQMLARREGISLDAEPSNVASMAHELDLDLDDDEPDWPGGFDPEDEDCKNCEHYAECLEENQDEEH